MSTQSMIKGMAREARGASRELRKVGRERKDAALQLMATKLEDRKGEIKKANDKDVSSAKEMGMGSAMIDRLTLDDGTIRSMADGLNEVAGLPDPVGQVTGMWKRPNGLVVGRVRIPLGVVGFIYESRPNVTVDAAGLCLKSGNAVILKGGSEAINSNLILADVLGSALEEAGLPQKAIQVIPTTDREAVGVLLGLEEDVDVIIPRGGEGLIRFSSTIRVYAMSTWMSSLIWTWPQRCASTPRFSGQAYAMPWRQCLFMNGLQRISFQPRQNGFRMRAWR
jgi:glutamate-5-semialdehyde dehydrogenase